MQGQYLVIGGRRTYFPPFVNERFGEPPYWACTFASLLNGANVGWLGRKPATVAEIRALAKASGDVDTSGGSRASHMVTAMRVLYGRKMQIESLTPERVKERLAKGWAMVAGLTYGELPEIYRRPSPHFKKGHRVVLIGWDGDRTRLLDPMQNRDSSFAGQWIKWSEFAPAWWSAEQLWFREGMGLPAPEVKAIATFAPARKWSVRAGTVIRGLKFEDPREVVRRFQPTKDTGAAFDGLYEVTPREPGAERLGQFIRVTTGGLAGLLIDPKTPGMTADLSKTPSNHAAALDPIGEARRQGAIDQFHAIKDVFDKTGSIPNAPL